LALRQQLFHLLASGQTSLMQQEAVLHLVVEVLLQASAEQYSKPSFKRRKAAVETVQHFVKDNPNRAITITELCELVHMSRRSLQYSFEDVLGSSPLQYLKSVRLNAVRRKLQNGANASTSIAAIAAEFGFWHPAQFSADYKHLFGENPSQTLGKDN
jgi:AraC family ethanolamine operon transcriptional activator